MKHTLKDWFMVTRPWGYALSIMPAVLALAYIFYQNSISPMEINWWYGVLAIIASPILQAGGNMMSDYYDYKNNVDRKETFGSSRMLVNKQFEPKEVYWFSISCMIVGNLVGLFLLYKLQNLHLLWIGVAGMIGSYFYFFMKYRALGDLNIFIIYGLLISLGTYLVMTNKLSWEILMIAAAPGLLIIAVLHANNTRDIKHDSVVNIKTAAMLLGIKGSINYYIILGVGAYLLIVICVIIGIQHWLSLIVFVSFPVLMKNIKQIKLADIDKPELIQKLDENTAQLVMMFMTLLVVANFAAGLI
ncbi:MAG: 1,4-dihydroxy-2-naphthoate octaprenyltransferase [Porphyromonadaceae bacterium]|jgi:1,4-dihydroxy-2-naphthoate octaprenyltransferase|nr:1,4-dihydroxy-2-naphthoate octaprenyltransferase [Porphyromonadaceae bacterium]